MRFSFLLLFLVWKSDAEIVDNVPDNDMFSSVSEMSKLRKLEIQGVKKLQNLNHLLNNSDTLNGRLKEVSELSSQLKELFGKLPEQTEIEGAANGNDLDKGICLKIPLI